MSILSAFVAYVVVDWCSGVQVIGVLGIFAEKYLMAILKFIYKVLCRILKFIYLDWKKPYNY